MRPCYHKSLNPRPNPRVRISPRQSPGVQSEIIDLMMSVDSFAYLLWAIFSSQFLVFLTPHLKIIEKHLVLKAGLLEVSLERSCRTSFF